MSRLPAGLARQPFSSPHMQGVKGFSSTFPVEANGIHDAIGSGDSRRNLAFVVDICAHPPKAFNGGAQISTTKARLRRLSPEPMAS